MSACYPSTYHCFRPRLDFSHFPHFSNFISKSFPPSITAKSAFQHADSDARHLRKCGSALGENPLGLSAAFTVLRIDATLSGTREQGV